MQQPGRLRCSNAIPLSAAECHFVLSVVLSQLPNASNIQHIVRYTNWRYNRNISHVRHSQRVQGSEQQPPVPRQIRMDQQRVF